MNGWTKFNCPLLLLGFGFGAQEEVPGSPKSHGPEFHPWTNTIGAIASNESAPTVD
jgi:hypothetical protein